MKLSILDQSPIRKNGTASEALAETIALAKAADRLGYHRYWVAEHHNSTSFAGSAPEILIARLATETRRIRIGSGGVMLMHYSPLKVAEQFRMLETLAPGRIDLGIGRAPGADERTSRALQAGPQAYGIDAFPSQVHLLSQLLDAASAGTPLPPDHPYRGIHAMPRGDSHPQLWLLGSGIHSAVYAAEFGLPFAHAHFINPDDSRDAVNAYRERFKPSVWCAAPRVAMGVAALAADSAADAEQLSASRKLWAVRLFTGRPIAFPPPEEALAYPYDERERAILKSLEGRSVTGTAEDVKAQLLYLASAHGADELMIVTITYDFDARLHSYELLAAAFADLMTGPDEGSQG
ncbi:MAG: LLM class flavin-dependent oxidoreductase [Alphaproteobacteria bacterium]|nr:LLM class flavin-dependent oxidoreductase [Alphaproteobacteria bacterium]